MARSSFSAILQALTAGLQPEPAAYAAGLKDGDRRAAFAPGELDLYSYALGYQRGRQFSTSKGGAHAL